MHWEVQLLGDPVDLRMLSESMCGGDISICETDGEYILRSEELNRLQDVSRVRARAEEITTSLSGTSRVILGAYKQLKVGVITQVRDDGTRTICVPVETGAARARGFPVSVSMIRKDGTVKQYRPADPVEAWLAAAAQHPSISKALRLRNAGNLTWVELYRIFEVIEGDIGKAEIVAAGWSKDIEIKRFKHTANSVSAAGDQARHGKETTTPPKDPMSLEQARAFIDALLKVWVNSKNRRR